jgi:dextranase
MIELLPAKATFAPGETIEVEARGAANGAPVRLFHLDRLVAEAAVGEGRATFSAQPEGGYGVQCGEVSGALDVLASPLRRLRYGFVSHYEAGRSADGVAENVRRFHLNAVQFYDWMYRHADLVPSQDQYEDALGQRLSLATVRSLIAAVAVAGSLPLAYAAVYAVGEDAWPQWESEALYRADGTPWSLGDFLRIVDPCSERWLTHLCAELGKAMDVGFAGFHLDQYGWPKWGLREDGRRVDVADALPALISRVAEELPGAKLVFNNVNDFPTWATAAAPQAATYIEVWAPHTRLRDLADLVAKARGLAPQRPVVLAAYLPAYHEDERGALVGEMLLLATVFSSGATALLHGEEGAVLTDPYYVRHHTLQAEARDVVRRYFDFAVRYGDLLFDPAAVDVTRSHFGGDNEEVRVEAPVPVSADAQGGTLWCRVFRVGGGLVIHLIDLSRQGDDEWATPKRSAPALAGVRVSVLRRGREAAAILAAAPAGAAALEALPVETTDRYDSVELASLDTWALIQVREGSE